MFWRTVLIGRRLVRKCVNSYSLTGAIIPLCVLLNGKGEFRFKRDSLWGRQKRVSKKSIEIYKTVSSTHPIITIICYDHNDHFALHFLLWLSLIKLITDINYANYLNNIRHSAVVVEVSGVNEIKR